MKKVVNYCGNCPFLYEENDIYDESVKHICVLSKNLDLYFYCIDTVECVFDEKSTPVWCPLKKEEYTFTFKEFSNERIVNILLNTIKYFYEGTNRNYYDTIYFKKCKTVTLDNTLINDINNNQNSSLLYINNLVEFSVLYLNKNILRSLNYEKELNRLLYLFATNYAVSKSFDKSGSIEYLKGQTLYNITKLYISNKSPEQTYFKEYKI
jgi:hypothetical protein